MSKVSITSDGQVNGSKCECKAGDGHCSHSIGLLYLICHFFKLGLSAIPPIQSKTSLPQTWHIPQRTEGLAAQPVHSLKITKVKPNPSQPKKKRRVTEGIVPNLYCPVPQPVPSTAFTETLLTQLTSINSDAQILSVISRDNPTMSSSKFGPVPKGSVLSYQQKPITLCDSNIIIHQDHPTFPQFPLPQQDTMYTTVLNCAEFNVYMGFHIINSMSSEIEEQTQHQSHNKIWHDMRENRLTSSIFKSICSRVGDHSSLASQLLKKRNIQTAAMKFGLQHEPVAAKLYSEITGNNVYMCGFVINPSAPHLGTSPDRKVFDADSTPPFGLLEIKCPDKDSFAECGFLLRNKTDGTYKLRRINQYYYQVMGQMALTGLEWCDFFVKCRQDYHMERVVYDGNAWAEMKTKLDLFYFEFYLPKICEKK